MDLLYRGKGGCRDAVMQVDTDSLVGLNLISTSIFVQLFLKTVIGTPSSF